MARSEVLFIKINRTSDLKLGLAIGVNCKNNLFAIILTTVSRLLYLVVRDLEI